MGLRPLYLIDLIVAALCCIIVAIACRSVARRRSPWRKTLSVLLRVALVIVVLATLVVIPEIGNRLNHVLVAWLRCTGLFITAILGYGFGLSWLMRRTGMFRPERRRALRVMAGGAVAAPGAVAAFAIVHRQDLQFREIDVPIRSLPEGLNGLRIAQLTDIHLSPFLSEATV